MPLYSGKGRLLLEAEPYTIIESPIRDTMTQHKIDSAVAVGRYYTPVIPVEFVVDHELMTEWRVRPTRPWRHSFAVTAILDSIYVVDSARYYSVYSSEVLNMIGYRGVENRKRTNGIDLDP